MLGGLGFVGGPLLECQPKGTGISRPLDLYGQVCRTVLSTQRLNKEPAGEERSSAGQQHLARSFPPLGKRCMERRQQ